MIGNPKEIHNAKAQEEERDIDVGWDITTKDVERLSVMQPLTPQTVYITPPDDDYVAPATNPMSNKQLNIFEEEFSHIIELVLSMPSNSLGMSEIANLAIFYSWGSLGGVEEMDYPRFNLGCRVKQ
ncbi:hypothetical protein Tco_1027189 [Tanacetum coccineum]